MVQVPETLPSYPTLSGILARGDELLRNGDASGAAIQAERILAFCPDDPDARRLLALSFFLRGELERALVLFEGLLLDVPESTSVKVNLAVVLLKVGRASAARPLLEAVVVGAPEHRAAWGYLGVALEQLGLVTDAELALCWGHHKEAITKLRQRHGLEPGLDGDVSFARTLSSAIPSRDVAARGLSLARTIPPRSALLLPASVDAARETPSTRLLRAALASLVIEPAAEVERSADER
jgi:tetratricopeptide (TPR) repeat protein